MSELKKHNDEEQEKEMQKAIMEEKDLQIRQRLVALNYHQKAKTELDDQQEAEMNAIKKKYEALSQPILDKQYAIISGQRAVQEEEVKEYEATVGSAAPAEALQDASPINGFWFQAMQNSDVVGEEIRECDEEALKSLKEVRVSKTFDGDKPQTLTVTFSFSQNEFFSNETLSKTFKLDERDGHAISSEGTEIQWKEGKNVTKSTVKKQQKHKKSGEKRTVQKTVQQESFFNFFGSVDVAEEVLDNMKEDEVEEAIERMDSDWLIAENIDEEVVPFGLEYYLNVIAKMPECDEDDEDDEGCCNAGKCSKKK